MSSTKKRRDLNRAIEEHKTVRLSAQLATSNHTMLNIAESILAKDNEALRAQIAELTKTNLAQAAQIEMLRKAVAEVEAKYFALIYDKDIEAEGFKEEGDMYGWNFHSGMRSGAVEMHLNMTKLLKALSITPSQALADFATKVREQCCQAVQPEDSYQDEWFKAKVKAVEQIRNLKELP